MGNNIVDENPIFNEATGSETTIEIKIKTLDAQTYTLRVDKQMPVPALKEQIATVTGVLSEQQRLICRGKVLKDDQLLSAYHVEDGHTLHMVVRQPLSPSDPLLNNTASEPNSSSSHGFSQQVAPGVVIETFSLPMRGDGIPPEINRIVSAVLGSIELSNMVGGSTVTDVRESRQQRQESISGADNLVDSNQHQSVEAGRSGSLGQPIAASLGSLLPPVIPDSLSTLSHYINHMRREFDATATDRVYIVQEASERGTEGRSSNSATNLGVIQEGFPTPASLAEVMLSARQILLEPAGDCLLQLARQLENQVNVTDPTERLSTQSRAWRTGVLLHNLGALFLELGRTAMTLRMGQSPSEAVVNAGPAVFISQSTPNPIMVQPLPFQPSSNSSGIPSGMTQPGSSLINGLGTGFLPRRIDIQIRRGSSTTPNANREENNSGQNHAGQREFVNGAGDNLDNQSNTMLSNGPNLARESGVRIVPVRTMIAAMPGPFSRLPLDSSNNSIGLYYPLLGRFQQPASGNGDGELGSGPSEERSSNGLQAEQHSVSEFVVQQLNVEDLARDGSSTLDARQQGPPGSPGINVNILSASVAQNNQDSNRELPDTVVNFLRTLFPSDEIRLEDASVVQTAMGSVPDPETTSNAVVDRLESDSGASEEGIFLSNLLRQIMPHVSQQRDTQNDTELLVSSMEERMSDHRRFPDSSTQAMNGDVGMSSRRNDNEADAPCSKRQKTE